MDTLSGPRGELNLATLEALPYEVLRTWIAERLHGRDARVAGDTRQGEPPYAAIADAYLEMSRGRQDAFADIVIGFVNDMGGNPDSLWRSEPAHQLLLLAQRVCTQMQLGPALVEMAERRMFFEADRPEAGQDLHYRVLQTLVELEWRERPEFWHEQVRLAPDRYAGVGFSGLALIGPEHAVALLPTLPWSDAVEDQVRTELPYFIAQQGTAVVRPLLEQCLSCLSVLAASAVREIAAGEHLGLGAARPGIAPAECEVPVIVLVAQYVEARTVLAGRGYNTVTGRRARLE